MSNRKKRRVASEHDRERFYAQLAAETGQTIDEVREHIRQAVEQGWLRVTAGGWQATIPGELPR